MARRVELLAEGGKKKFMGSGSVNLKINAINYHFHSWNY